MMQAGSLRVRVVAGSVALLAVVLVVVNCLVYVALRVQLLNDLDGLLDDRADLAAHLAPTMGTEDLVERLDGSDVHVVARLPDGRVVRSEPVDPTIPVPAEGADATGGRLRRDVALADGTVVRLSAQERADDTTTLVVGPYVVGTLVGLVTAALLLWWIVTRSLRPLDHVVVTARRIKDGQTDERLAPERTDTELGQMAAAFDEMLDALARALADARASDERSRRFLAEAAHQLRTPLAGIQASAEALPAARSRTDRDRLVANLAREAARAGRRVGDLLRVVRIDQGDEPTRRPHDVALLCREEVARTAALAPGLDVVAGTDVPLVVCVDAEALREALANLLDNARRHAIGRIDVRVASFDGMCEISVVDDGPGLADPQRSFERFVSLDGHGGSGLGLSIALGIARTHGGDLTYEPPAFVIRVPIDAPGSPRDVP